MTDKRTVQREATIHFDIGKCVPRNCAAAGCFRAERRGEDPPERAPEETVA